MGHHYLPRYYLKGFLQNPQSRFLYQYEKGKGRAIKGSLENLAQENNLYSPELETRLNAEIEEPAKRILDKIRGKLRISETEKKTFSEYVVIMMMRIPEKKETVKQWFESVKEPYFDRLESDLIGMRTSRPEKKDIIERRLQELKGVRDKGTISSEEIWHSVVDLARFPKILWAIQNMTWNFLVSNNLSILTGDNPVSYFKDIGLKDNRAELCFPISKDIALLAGWQNNKDCQYLSAKANEIHEINRRTSAFAVRYVFHHRDEEWVLKLLNKITVAQHP